MTATTTAAVFAAGYPAYRDLGWCHPIKLSAGTKHPPPKGFTGHDGAEPSGADLHTWAEEEPDGNLAIRLNPGFIGIDCDDYGDKNGAATIAEATARWGRLPYSPQSTSRGIGPSGIRIYRIPPGIKLVEKLSFPDLGLGGVELIQHHHRYVVAWPSVHPNGGRYQWLGIDGGPLDRPPALSDIPDLPQKWLDGLREPETPTSTSPLGAEGPYNVRAALTEGEPSRRVSAKLGEAIMACQSGSRHDNVRDHVLGLLRCGKQGEPGVLAALTALQKVFVAAVEKDRAGGREEATSEFRKFVFGDRVSTLLAEPAYDDGPSAVIEVDAAEFTTGDQDTRTAPTMADLLLTRAALRTLPDPEPLIDNVLDQGTVGLLYGRWGTGKSFVTLDWALSVATGRAWQGRATRKCRVLYVAAEGAYGLKGRIDAWETGWQTQVGDTIDILPRAVNLTRGRDIVELAALVEANGYGLIVIDTLARCMVGADENSAKDCGEVVDTLVRLREHTPAGRGVVLGVHHTGKDGKTFRGSSVFEAGADTVYALSHDEGVLLLEREKRKDGPPVDRHTLKIDPVPGSGSCVISSTSGVESSPRAEALLSTFLHHFSTTGASKTDLRKVSDLTDGTFYRALSDLLKSGQIVNEGTDKRPFYRAVRA